jgi:sugar-specific transcriptional regulator TrmB
MADDSEFITKLIGFGLSEKEAQLYLHLLKYGPKPTSLLAKSLKTYREDVHRTLTSLIDKGMVNPSIETPTVYAAEELDMALDVAMKKQESELREMEVRKRELHELAQQQRFRPSDEVSTFKIIKNMKEVIANSIPVLSSSKEEWSMVVSEMMLLFSSLFAVIEGSKNFIERGGKVNIITDISYQYIDLALEHLNVGINIRHYDKYREIYFGVFDRKISASAINADIKHISLDESVSVLWTDDLMYASYLTSTFELLWEQAVPATQRIEELLKEGPPQV